MAATERPKIKYSWIRGKCVWSLVSPAGETMCTSWPARYEDKASATKAFDEVMSWGVTFTEICVIEELEPNSKPEGK